jgi:creatinine amidohydrolase
MMEEVNIVKRLRDESISEAMIVSMADMTWTQVQDQLEHAEIALLPVGSIEQHGPHLPLLHDVLSANVVCVRTAERIYPRALVAPPLHFGDSSQWTSFPGTISIRARTLVELVVDICESLAQHGFERVVIVNGHAPNMNPLWEAAWRVDREVGIKVAYLSYWSFIPQDAIDGMGIETTTPGHADEFETSFALAAFPERVREDEIRMSQSRYEVPKEYTFRNGVYMTHFDTQLHISETGCIGDPSQASAEKGQRLLNGAVTGLVNFLNYYLESPFAARSEGS